MDKREEHIDYELLARYVSDELDSMERDSVDQWINSSEENRAIMEECKKIFSMSFNESSIKSTPSFHSGNAWKKVSSRIGIVDQETPVIPLKPDLKEETSFSAMVWVRIAAVLVAGFAAVFYFTRPEPITRIATTDSIREILLPDSSQVTLNKNSSLAFNKGFGTSHRELTIEGTAYFDVKRDESLLFSIQTKTGIVSVLGTAFLIEETTNALTVTVERGKVKLQSATDENVEMILEINEKGVLVSNSIKKIDIESLNNLYWANKKLIYKQELLANVLEEMRIIFDKSIQFDSATISDCRISAVFKDESFESMMDHMALSLDFKYFTSGDVVTVTSNGCKED
jgi:transmembrane sensor